MEVGDKDGLSLWEPPEKVQHDCTRDILSPEPVWDGDQDVLEEGLADDVTLVLAFLECMVQVPVIKPIAAAVIIIVVFTIWFLFFVLYFLIWDKNGF